MGGDLFGKSQNTSKGIYTMAFQDVFLLKNQSRYRNLNLEVYVTFEIYNGKLFDPLNRKAKLHVLEGSKQQVQVVALLEYPVNCADDVMKMINTAAPAGLLDKHLPTPIPPVPMPASRFFFEPKGNSL